ncbi:hypothetical protein BPO_1878 [Bergeyella porcorum]|uniref:Uncharacterized protein n=1 Tax=Bergeyella porcorum TaxID=1735111 RepID=A0AAU0F3K6_9FLAO
MTDLDLLHFEQLKAEIQSKYLESHTPSHDEISKWKGIDIVYFQEDLRKFAKGNISEKSFYTYFKTTPATKLPRIDILNLLSAYAGYASWYDFKKQHLFTNEILTDENLDEESEERLQEDLENTSTEVVEKEILTPKNEENTSDKKADLQISNTDNQYDKLISIPKPEKNPNKIIKNSIWAIVSAVLLIFVGVLTFKDNLFSKQFTYTFIDADRNSKINDELSIQILKNNESPILFRVKPNTSFVYTTKSSSLTMVVSSPYYKTDTIRRNLENAPTSENIELIPDDYAIMLYYYSNSIQDLKKKRESLGYLISDNALIYQIYDNDQYGVETLDKQRYINLVTTPTTSLENLQVIDTKMENGKIVLIKFKINEDDEQHP